MKRASESKRPYITVYESIGGWKAVHIWWNPESFGGGSGFWEPYQVGLGSYATKEEAAEEAKSWAQDEGMEFYCE